MALKCFIDKDFFCSVFVILAGVSTNLTEHTTQLLYYLILHLTFLSAVMKAAASHLCCKWH